MCQKLTLRLVHISITAHLSSFFTIFVYIKILYLAYILQKNIFFLQTEFNPELGIPNCVQLELQNDFSSTEIPVIFFDYFYLFLVSFIPLL